MRHFLFACVVLSFFAACKNPGSSKESLSPNALYFDYRIWGEDGRGDATLRLQYKTGDEEGEAIAWEAPAKVLFDNAEINVDSSRFTGAYYEITKPVTALSGKHEILFLDKNKKEHRERFSFDPFELAEELPETLAKSPFQIRLQNFPKTATAVRLVMVDTSLRSVGVNEELVVKEGMVQITAQHLTRLTTGPVTLEIIREEEKPLGQGREASGKFTITYGLRREFNLAD